MIATAMMAGLGTPMHKAFGDNRSIDGDPRPKSKRHQDQGNAVKLSKKQKAKRRHENKAD